MPSSLIIVALAAAWLIVLVPMIARKRQEVARTADSALAARIVRSGNTRSAGKEELVMPETARPSTPATTEDEQFVDEGIDYPSHGYDVGQYVEDVTEGDEADDAGYASESSAQDWPVRRYRPGRGGFDPEAAEMAARAKYAYRQRVVLGLLIAVVLTGVAAGFVWSMLWWVNVAADVALVGYLGYLRRQVRIENEIRERRLARLNEPAGTQPARARASVPEAHERDQFADESPDTMDVEDDSGREPVPFDRSRSASTRAHEEAVVVELDDEDPAFHELAQPGDQPFRKASGE